MVTRRRIITSLIYKFTERIAARGVAFVVGIILARLLMPEDYGVLAILLIFTNIAQVFVQSGLSTALIQKKDADIIDYSTVFYTTLATATIFYALLFFTSPIIAEFYKMPQLTIFMRVLALVLFSNSYNSIQNAKLTKEMRFKRILFVALGANLISGAVGLTMAFSGFGVWSLIAQQLAASIVSCILMLFAANWVPKLVFSTERLKGLFSFGWKMLVSGLLDTVYGNLRGLIIGKRYSSSDLAYYNNGAQYPKVLVESVNGSIMSVMFPAFVSVQDDTPRIKAMVRRSILMSTFTVFPAMAGVAATSEAFVTLVLTEKWLPCVPYMMVACGIYAFHPIHTANLQAIAALGHSDIFLKLEIVKKCYGLVVLTITVLFFDSPLAIMIGSLCSVPISCAINAFPNKRLLNYSIAEQVKDILPALLASLTMGVLVYCVTFAGLGNWSTLVVQVVLGIGLYVAFAMVFLKETAGYVFRLVKGIPKKSS